MASRQVVVQVTLTQNIARQLIGMAQTWQTFQKQMVSTNARTTTALTGSWFKFRDNFAATHRILNNVFARTIRRLARLRTMVFIIATFLAVRPIFRFFQGLIEDSAKVEGTLKLIDERWGAFRRQLAEKLLPIFVAFKKVFQAFQLDLLEFASRHGEFFKGLVIAIGAVSEAVKALAKSVVILTENWEDSFKLLGSTFKFLGKSIAAGFMEILRDAFAPGKVIPIVGKTITQLKAEYDRAIDDLKNFKVQADVVQEAWDALAKARARAMMVIENPGMAQGLPSIEPPGAGFTLFKSLMPFGLGTTIATELHKAFANTTAAYDREIGALVTHIDDLTTKGPLSELRDIWSRLLPTWLGGTGTALNIWEAFGDVVKRTLPDIRAILFDAGEKSANAFVEGFSSIYGGLREAFIKVEADLTEAATKMGEAIRKGLEESFSDYLVQAMEGRFNRIKDALVSFLQSVKKAIADFVSQRVIQNVLSLIFGGAGSPYASSGGLAGLIGSLFSNTGGSTPTGTSGHSPAPGPTVQSGGYVTRGGLVNVHAGEVIHAVRGAHRMPGMRQTMGSQVVVNFNIEATDAASFETWLERSKGKIKRIMTEAATGGDFAVRSAFRIAGR